MKSAHDVLKFMPSHSGPVEGKIKNVGGENKSIFEKKLLDAQNLNSRFLNYTFFRILSDPIEPEMTVKKKIPTFFIFFFFPI